MKKLIIVRHAKSDWEDFSLKDFDRTLSDRGHKNAPEMVGRLVDKNINPELIVSSPATRALTTAKYFAAGWQINVDDINLLPEIYEANTKTLLKVINNLADDFQNIAVFGHNPGLSNLLNYLTDDYVTDMPTCSVAIVEFRLESWKHVSAGTGKITMFDFPKSGLD